MRRVTLQLQIFAAQSQILGSQSQIFRGPVTGIPRWIHCVISVSGVFIYAQRIRRGQIHSFESAAAFLRRISSTFVSLRHVLRRLFLLIFFRAFVCFVVTH